MVELRAKTKNKPTELKGCLRLYVQYGTVDRVMADQTSLIDSLFKAGSHFGYSRSRRHPSALKFLFGVKGGVEIFDLEKTAVQMEKAATFIRSLAADRKTLLFVSSKAESREALQRTAESLNQPYVSGRFIGGTLTNWNEIKKRTDRLAELSSLREKGELAKFTKLERLLIDREIEELELMFGGLKGLAKIPNAMLVIDPRKEKIAVEEARKSKVPVIALLNSDCDASLITYPVPGNDATMKSVKLFLEQVKLAWEDGARNAPAPKDVSAETTEAPAPAAEPAA